MAAEERRRRGPSWPCRLRQQPAWPSFPRGGAGWEEEEEEEEENLGLDDRPMEAKMSSSAAFFSAAFLLGAAGFLLGLEKLVM